MDLSDKRFVRLSEELSDSEDVGLEPRILHEEVIHYTICPGSSDPFYIHTVKTLLRVRVHKMRIFSHLHICTMHMQDLRRIKY